MGKKPRQRRYNTRSAVVVVDSDVNTNTNEDSTAGAVVVNSVDEKLLVPPRTNQDIFAIKSTNDKDNFESSAFAIMDAYIKEKGLIDLQLNSYNNFIDNVFPEIATTCGVATITDEKRRVRCFLL